MATANTANMDTPESVAADAVKGLLNQEIDVFMGGEQAAANRKLNFEHPLQFDEKVKGMYDAMLQSAANHRAM